VHEVEGPDDIEFARCLRAERLPGREPPLRSSREIEPEGAVQPMDALAIPRLAVDPHAVAALPAPLADLQGFTAFSGLASQIVPARAWEGF